MKKITLLLSFIACIAFTQAQTLLVENFDYTIGSGIKAAGWNIHSGAGANPDSILVIDGLTLSGYPGSGVGGAAAINGKYADQHKTFEAQTSGTTYMSFLFKPVGAGAGNTATYFIHFGPSVIGTTFFSRVWINATGNGLGLGDSAPSSYINVTIGTTYLVVLKYDFATKTNSLYVSETVPSTEPTNANATFIEVKGPAASTPTNLGSVGLRQGQTSGNANQNVIVDGIRVATSWAALFATSNVINPSANKFQALVVGSDLQIKNVANGATVEIFSALGSKVQTSVLENGKVSIDNLSKGMYIVRVGKSTQKFML